MGQLKQPTFFISVLEAGGLRSGYQHGQVFGELPLPALHPLAASSRGGKGSCWQQHSHREGSAPLTSYKPCYLPETPPPNTIALGIRDSTYGLRGM